MSHRPEQYNHQIKIESRPPLTSLLPNMCWPLRHVEMVEQMIKERSLAA